MVARLAKHQWDVRETVGREDGKTSEPRRVAGCNARSSGCERELFVHELEWTARQLLGYEVGVRRSRAEPRLELAGFMPYRLSVAANAVSQAVARAYEKKYRLSTQEWRLLAVLAFGGELTQQELVGLTKMDKVTVSRAARSLEERCFVRRSKDEADARSLRLTLTATGRKTYDAIVPAALETQREILSVLEPGERSALKALLERVEAAAALVRRDG